MPRITETLCLMVQSKNGVANRDIRHFIRNPNNGLEDRSVDVRNIIGSEVVRNRIEFFRFLKLGSCWSYDKMVILMVFESNIRCKYKCANLEMKTVTQSTIKNTVKALLQAGRVGLYKDISRGKNNFLGL